MSLEAFSEVAQSLESIALPEAIDEFSLRTLTPEQLAELDKGPGRVTHPVTLERFTSADQLNNFTLYFAPEGSTAGVIYHRILCNRRFRIIYPAFWNTLQANYMTLRDSGLRSEAKQQILLHAYALMEGLVDRQDPGVLTQQGTVHTSYLWQ